MTGHKLIFTHFAFWPALPALEGQILSHVPIVKVAIIHFGSFWDKAGKILGNFLSPNQGLFPAQSQLHKDVSGGEPGAVIF